jgi:predicted PurR-regulated permease PerM
MLKEPLVVLVAVLIGHELLGLAGALFAIPLAAALAVIVDEVHQQRLLNGRKELDLDAERASGGRGQLALQNR